MEIQTAINELGDKQDSWIATAIKAHNLEITTAGLVEYIASYCLLEDLHFEVVFG